MNKFQFRLNKLENELRLNKQDQVTARQLGLKGALIDLENQAEIIEFNIELIEDEQ